MLNWFSAKEVLNERVDIHSHLLPGLDDGVNSYEEALEILKFFEEMGYEKVITTPHIYPDLFPNTPKDILKKLHALQQKVRESGMAIEIEAAAEYFMDGNFLREIAPGELLTMGTKYVLVETSFLSKPYLFDEVIFKLHSAGYEIVLAHPERYEYLEGDISWLRELKDRGVKLQVTVTSLVGAYGSEPKRIAQLLMKNKMVDFLGSDIHRSSQIGLLQKALKTKIQKQNLLNWKLI